MFGIVPPHLLLKITKASDRSRHKVSPLEKHENALRRGDMDGNNRGERGEKKRKKKSKNPTRRTQVTESRTASFISRFIFMYTG